MNHQDQSQQHQQEPAQASSKATGGKRSKRKARTLPTRSREEIQREALANAQNGTSEANYDAIFEGFAEMGIDPDDVIPRENVLTFNAWKALGRVVRRGQHGVRVATFVPCTKTDTATGEESKFRMPKTTTVFHISQTDPLPLQ